jgi:hypothetical protein
MEAASNRQLRARLILGKFRVVERTELTMKVALGGSTTMTVSVEPFMDVKAGDILTLYTEVLLAPQSSTN